MLHPFQKLFWWSNKRQFLNRACLVSNHVFGPKLFSFTVKLAIEWIANWMLSACFTNLMRIKIAPIWHRIFQSIHKTQNGVRSLPVYFRFHRMLKFSFSKNLITTKDSLKIPRGVRNVFNHLAADLKSLILSLVSVNWQIKAQL